MRKYRNGYFARTSLFAAASSTAGVLLSTLLATAALAQSPGGPPGGGPSGPGGPGGPGGSPPGTTPPLPEVDHSSDCSSDCLRTVMDKYLAAWAAHDPSSLQVTPTLRVAENGHAVALGDNVWKTIARLGAQKIVFADPFAGQVLALGTLEMRAHESFIYSVRLKIDKGRIAESETMVSSDKIAGQHFRPDLIGQSASQFSDLPAGQRLSRSDLLKQARIIWGLDSGTAPQQSDSCMHYENFESPGGGTHCRPGPGRDARERRIPLVDVEKGVVVKYQLEDFSDPQPRDPPPGEAETKTPIFYYWPLTFLNMQVAKVADGKFQADEVFMNIQQYGIPTVFRR